MINPLNSYMGQPKFRDAGLGPFFWVARVLGYRAIPLFYLLRPSGYLPGMVDGICEYTLLLRKFGYFA